MPLQLSGQSTGLVNQGSRVQFSPEAFYNQQYILIFTINTNCISTFKLVIRQTIPPCEKIQYGQSLNHAVVKINNSSPQFTTINCFFHFYLKISLNLFQKEESSQNCFCSSRTRVLVQFNKDQEFGQSTGLVNQGSRGQFSPEAFYNQQYILIFNINTNFISTFILVIRQTIPHCEKIQYGQSLIHAVVKNQ